MPRRVRASARPSSEQPPPPPPAVLGPGGGPTAPGESPGPVRRWVVVGLLAAGVALWLAAGNDMPPLRWAVVLGVVGLSLVPPVNRGLDRVLDRVRHPSPRAAEWAGVLIGVAATTYLIATAFAQDRGLAPKTHDDCSYVIGAQMLARGRLWMPQHPMADFFESFYVLVKPVYCSIYFPGTALMFAPMVWFGWASWILPVVLSGVIVGLLYRIVTELADGAAGALAAVWMVSLGWFRTLSILVMSHVAMLLLGLLVVWAWLRWRRDPRRWGWAAAVGAFSGWAAITRPADALAYAVPVGLVMAAGLWGQPARRWAATAAALVAGAAPFLALQVVLNVAVTGHPLRTPYTAYLERDQPGSEFGIKRYDPSWRPASALPQKQAHYDWCRRFFEHHQPHNFARAWFFEQRTASGQFQPSNLVMLTEATLPGRVLLVLLPAGLLALGTTGGSRGRWVLAATAPLFVLLYVFNPFFLDHYAVVVAPAVVLCVLLGCRAVAAAAGGPDWARRAGVALAAGVLAVAATSLWQVKRFMPTPGQLPRDGWLEGGELAFVHQAIDLTVRPPAVVLFATPPSHFAEPVYNPDVAWPDDAPVVRAHDLGERNREIIEYYARRQPDRRFYHFDWHGRGITPLGTAAALGERLGRGASIDSILNPPP